MLLEKKGLPLELWSLINQQECVQSWGWTGEENRSGEISSVQRGRQGSELGESEGSTSSDGVSGDISSIHRGREEVEKEVS